MRLLREAAPCPEGALLARDGLSEGGVAGEGGLLGRLFGLGSLLDGLLGGALLGGALLGGGLSGSAGHGGWCGSGVGQSVLYKPLDFDFLRVPRKRIRGEKIWW
jgi:hypothetical protein